MVAVYCLSVSERFLFMIRTYAVTGGFGLLPLQIVVLGELVLRAGCGAFTSGQAHDGFRTGSGYDVFDQVIREVTLVQYAGDEVGIELIC